MGFGVISLTQGSSRSLKLGANGLYFLGTQPGSLLRVKPIPQDGVGEKGGKNPP